MSNYNCLSLCIYKRGRILQILLHNDTLKTRVLCNFIHSRYFFTNKKSFHSLVSMTERQRRRQIDSLYADYSTLLPKETFFRGKYEYKDEKRTVPKNTRLEIAIGKCRGSHSISLKAFSTIFHNFSFKIFLHCNYPPSKIFKKDEPI